MKVCLIIEGAYPYVVGGVSAWTNNMIKSMPEIDFTILSIMSGKVGNFKYNLPDNVVDVKTVYLDGYIKSQKNYFVKQPSFIIEDVTQMTKLLNFDLSVDLAQMQSLISFKKSVKDIANFTRTKFFYNTICDRYENNYNKLDFNKFIWSSKGMYSPFLQMFSVEIPKADIYHAVSAGYAGLLGSLAKLKYDKPFILSEHGIYTRERQEEIIKANWVDKVFKVVWIDFFDFVSQLGYKYADAITSLFNDAKRLQVEYGALEKKCIVIANGVDTSQYSVNKQEHETFNIGFITRVVPIKDVLTAIRSFFLVDKKIKNVKFFVIGPIEEDEDYFQQCLELTAALELDHVVEFTGIVNVKDYLPILDVVMLSSVSEGQPLVLLEAMSSGIACIASDVGSCKEVLAADDEDKRCGLIFEPTMYNDLSNLLIELYKNPIYREELGANGVVRAKELYDYGLMITKYRKLYKNV